MKIMRKNKKLTKGYSSLIIFLLMLELGYALLRQNLTINGTSKLIGGNWNIYFDNLNISQGSKTLSENDLAATIDTNTKTDISYTITLQKPGDFYEFTVDVVNESTYDAMIESFHTNIKDKSTDEIISLPSFLEYSVTYVDGINIETNQLLEKNTTDSFRVKLEFKKDISSNQLPKELKSYEFNFGVTYVQADDYATKRQTRSFENDSWETIISNIKNNTIPTYYNIGSTKTLEIDIDNDNEMETYTVRIANKSKPNICNTTNFSQTSCGFVLEFVEVIVNHDVNVTYNNDIVGTGNVGGWKSSTLRTYINNTIYNALPTVLKDGIIDTKVVSGHGVTTGESDFITTDKLYLLSTQEVFGESSNDTIDSTVTRQLDYYLNNNNSLSSHDSSIKKYDGSNTFWWLRSACDNTNNYFNDIDTTGGATNSSVTDNNGVSPAFRIG